MLLIDTNAHTVARVPNEPYHNAHQLLLIAKLLYEQQQNQREKSSLLYHPSLDLSLQSDYWTTKPHNTVQTLARANFLSSQNSTAALRTTLATQQALQPSRFLCCSTKQAIRMHETFALFFCTIRFSFQRYFFSPHECAIKVILDAESNSADSSRHSQGTPGSTHKTGLFKDAAVTLCAFTCCLPRKNTSLDQTS